MGQRLGGDVRRNLAWDVAMGAVVVGSVAPAIISRATGGEFDPRLVWLGVGSAGLAAAYLTIVRPGLGGAPHDVAPWRGAAFAPVAAVLLAIAIYGNAFGATLQAGIYSLIWVLSPTRRSAILRSTLVAVAALIGFAAHSEFTPLAWGYATAVAALSLGFAIAMGLWITHTFEKGEVRARLLTELTATQDRLAALERERGAGAERERLAREIHDTLAQTLAGLVLLTERAVQHSVPGSPAAAALASVETLARDALGEARQLVERTAAVPSDRALEDAVTRLAERFRIASGLEVNVTYDGDEGLLDREAQVVVLRFVQEGLANVRKHAEAKKVMVSIETRGGEVTVAVVDNGRGFDPSAASIGFGLEGMRERLALARGHLDIVTAPGRGTTLRAVLPTETTEATEANP